MVSQTMMTWHPAALDLANVRVKLFEVLVHPDVSVHEQGSQLALQRSRLPVDLLLVVQVREEGLLVLVEADQGACYLGLVAKSSTQRHSFLDQKPCELVRLVISNLNNGSI